MVYTNSCCCHCDLCYCVSEEEEEKVLFTTVYRDGTGFPALSVYIRKSSFLLLMCIYLDF